MCLNHLLGSSKNISLLFSRMLQLGLDQKFRGLLMLASAKNLIKFATCKNCDAASLKGKCLKKGQKIKDWGQLC